MDRNLNVSNEALEHSEVLRHICELNFPIIYTTNYDNCLEMAHETFGCKYHKVTKVEDLCDMDIDTTQIVKFHGDFEDDYSIFKLNNIWKRSTKQSQKPKSYMFLGVPNPIQETILESRGIVSIVGEDVDATVNLENFLKELCEKSKKR